MRYLWIAVLLLLSACTTGGYSRAYIITDTTGDETVSESPEKR